MNDQGLSIQFAVLDGKQRLESIAQYLDGDLTLPDDFWLYEDRSVEAAGMDFDSLQAEYGHLAQRILDFELPIIEVSADSGDLVEEMFLRLNASTALNAAERRNAIAGATRDCANALAEHRLLVTSSPIRGARYKHRELAAKFLAIEEQLVSKGRIADTKAATLYELFVATKPQGRISEDDMRDFASAARRVLDAMSEIFEENDPLLASIGTLTVYYIAFRDERFAHQVSRPVLDLFESLRRAASAMSEDDAEYARPANARLREYNVFVQSSNDGRALTRRAEVLSKFVLDFNKTDPLASLDDLSDGDLPAVDDPED